jgi:sugar phosphate isomerase/epimerase
MNRRNFIQTTSGALAFALPALHFARKAPVSYPAPGVQLFTFFNILDNDVEGTLKQAAAAGIVNIESAFSKKGDYYGMPAKQFRQLLNGLGMQWRSHHVFGTPIKLPAGMPVMKNLKENLKEILDDAAAGGLQYLVAAHLPIGTTDEIKSSLDILNASAGPCKKAGIQLVYHNEPADFKKVDGKTPYETFLTQTNPQELKFELDIAWALKAGQKPEELFSRYPGRFPLWHIKGIQQDFATVVPIGEGVVDYKQYFALAGQSGLHYYFIEHEAAKEPIASIAKSIQTLKTITTN